MHKPRNFIELMQYWWWRLEPMAISAGLSAGQRARLFLTLCKRHQRIIGKPHLALPGTV